MKRLFLIIIMTWLPFQMSWAAVTGYCQHEQGRAAQHFGHHTHKHQAAKLDKYEKQKVKVDQDCGYCHLSCLKFTCSLLSITLPFASQAHVAYDVGGYHFYIPNIPSKPNWGAAS